MYSGKFKSSTTHPCVTSLLSLCSTQKTFITNPQTITHYLTAKSIFVKTEGKMMTCRLSTLVFDAH